MIVRILWRNGGEGSGASVLPARKKLRSWLYLTEPSYASSLQLNCSLNMVSISAIKRLMTNEVSTVGYRCRLITTA